jgi:release factor glutamine methyltransferase
MFALMTLNELYRIFLVELEQIYQKSEAANICSMVFESKTGLTRSGIVKDPTKLLDEKTIAQLSECLSQLKMHKPVQYVIGEAWFCKMKLKVSSAVLIPRPETEELVEAVIRYLKNKPASSLLDIGTGSGCIAIAIKKNLPATNVTAIDISDQALAVAHENSQLQQTNINFIKLDFLDESTWKSLPAYDVIVSNPPYIPEKEIKSLDKNVTEYEPHLALFVEDVQPLIFYEKIALFGKTHLQEPGKIFLETHEQYAVETAALFNCEYYKSMIIKDLFEKQRLVIATRRYR